MGAEHKSKVYALHKLGKNKLRLFLGNFCVCYKVSPYPAHCSSPYSYELRHGPMGKDRTRQGGRIQSLCEAQTKAAKLS
jgi:hypothetical protein